jgi:hypothetical protein
VADAGESECAVGGEVVGLYEGAETGAVQKGHGAEVQSQEAGSGLALLIQDGA